MEMGELIPDNGTNALRVMASKVGESSSMPASRQNFRGQENSHGIPLAPADNVYGIRIRAAAATSQEPRLSG